MASKTYLITMRQKAPLLVGLFAILVVLMALSPHTAHGHASLLGTTPADGEHLKSSPSEVVLEFSEPVGLVEGGTTLHSADSEPVVLSPQASGSTVSIPLEPVGDGAYIVQWRVISADAHPISGTVSFTVGNAEAGGIAVNDELPGWAEWTRSLAVGVKYFGLLSALGVLLVGRAIVRSDLAIVIRLSLLFSLVGLFGIALELPLAGVIQQGSLTSSVHDLWSAVTNLQSNTLIAAVMGGILVLLALATKLVSWSDDRQWQIITGLITGAVLTLILSGHSRTREPVVLIMISDAIHITVASIWLGGIILLAIGLRGRWRGSGFSSPDASAIAVSRFSTLAGYTAALVAVSGVVMAVVILDSLEALYSTDYGIALLIKTGLVGAVAVMAAVNRFYFIPRLAKAKSAALPGLQRLVSWELVILIAVVAVTGNLVHEDPNVATSTPQQPASVTLYEGESPLDSSHTIRMSVKSRSAKQVTVVATIIDDDRNIVLPEADLQLNWSLPDQGLGPLTQELQIDPETGAYSGVFILPAGGEWELGAQIRIDRFTDSRTTVSVTVPD